MDEEELHDTIDVQLLSHLVGDVSEGGLDEAVLSSLYDLKASDRKSKADSNKKKIKRHGKRRSFPHLQLFPNEWHIREQQRSSRLG